MERNSHLGRLLALAGWSPEELAHEINKRYGAGTISTKAPYGWLKGAFPRGQVAQLVVESLSDRLGSAVQVEQVWPLRSGHRLQLALAAQLRPPWTAERLIESGNRLADPWDAEALERPDLTPLAGAALVSAAVDWMTADPATLRPRTRGVEVSAETINALTHRTSELRQLCSGQGGVLVASWCAGDLRWAIRLVSEMSGNAESLVELLGIVAELAQLAGWLLVDMGRRAEAQYYLLTALYAAAMAGDRIFAGYVLSCLSYDLTWHGDARDALRLLQIARKGIGEGAVGPIGAILATRTARAHASLGEESECSSALAEAAELLDPPIPSATPAWCQWVTPAVLAADAGRAWLDLNHPDRAEDLLLAGLDALDEQLRQDKVLHLASVTEARLARGQVDGAAESVHSAIELAGTVNSGRARHRLRRLSAIFSRCDAAVARDVSGHIAQLLDDSNLSVRSAS